MSVMPQLTEPFVILFVCMNLLGQLFLRMHDIDFFPINPLEFPVLAIVNSDLPLYLTVTEEWGGVRGFSRTCKRGSGILNFCRTLDIVLTASELNLAGVSSSSFPSSIWENIQEKNKK